MHANLDGWSSANILNKQGNRFRIVIKLQPLEIVSVVFLMEYDMNNKIPATPSEIINDLCTFYRKNKDYKTDITTIFTLYAIAHHEFEKFIKRPHKQVTYIRFDDQEFNGV